MLKHGVHLVALVDYLELAKVDGRYHSPEYIHPELVLHYHDLFSCDDRLTIIKNVLGLRVKNADFEFGL